MPDNATATVGVKPDIDLGTLADTIRRHHQQAVAAIGRALDHAMAAGDALIAARKKVPPGGWETWLHQCDLNERTARRYTQFAKGRSIIEAKRSSATDLSLAGALRLLGNKSGAVRESSQQQSQSPKLSPLAWSGATPEERRHFLNAAGLSSLLESIPTVWRNQFERHVDPQHVFDDKIAKVLRLALAQLRSADSLTPEAISALHTLNKLIVACGRDLHEIVGLKFNRALTVEKRTKAKAA
jgi:hypothetical protein